MLNVAHFLSKLGKVKVSHKRTTEVTSTFILQSS